MEAKETSYKASLKGSLDSTKSKLRSALLKASKSVDEREKPTTTERFERFIVPEEDASESKTMQLEAKYGKSQRCNESKESKLDSNGRARSLGFQSIRVGLSRNEYQELVSKSPFKPAYAIINERIQLQQQLQQQGLASITSGNVSIASMIQTLPSISEDKSKSHRNSTEFKEEPDAKSRTFTLTAANTYTQDVYDGEDDNTQHENDNEEEDEDEEYANEEFAVSPTSRSSSRRYRGSQNLDNENDNNEYDEFKDVPVHVMKLSDPIYSEIQSENLINKRFNWNGGRKDFSEFEMMNASSSASGMISSSSSSSSLLPLPGSPDTKERVTRIRQTMIRGAPSSTPGNNKFNRNKQLGAGGSGMNSAGGGSSSNHHLPVSADYIPGFDSEDNDTHLSIFQNYSGLLYKDPSIVGAWNNLNLPSKVKYHNTAFSSAKRALHAGKMVNSYRPWGPDRPIDPLDQLLEKQIAAKLGGVGVHGHLAHHSSSHTVSSGVDEEGGAAGSGGGNDDWEDGEEEFEEEEDGSVKHHQQQQHAHNNKVRFGTSSATNSVASASSHTKSSVTNTNSTNTNSSASRPGASHAQRSGTVRQESPLGGMSTNRRGSDRGRHSAGNSVGSTSIGTGGGRHEKTLDGVHRRTGSSSSSSPTRKSRGNSRSRTPQESTSQQQPVNVVLSPPKPRTTLIINHVPKPA